MDRQPIARRGWRRVAFAAASAVLAIVFGLLGITPASAVMPTYTYDTAAYAYATPAQLSTLNAAMTHARGSPAGSAAASWATHVAVRGFVLAAETAGSGAATSAGLELTMTKTVAGHVGEATKSGTLARPYGNSRLTIQSIMDAVEPVADPGGVPGALRWDAPGAMNGSPGTWQLIVDTNSRTILRYLFEGAK
jgi:hypothetical protein